ncbi:hypothetical protein PMIN03_009235 [Paraphaeosphaeria minitans]
MSGVGAGRSNPLRTDVVALVARVESHLCVSRTRYDILHRVLDALRWHIMGMNVCRPHGLRLVRTMAGDVRVPASTVSGLVAVHGASQESDVFGEGFLLFLTVLEALAEEKRLRGG